MPQPDIALFSPLPRAEVIKAVERRSPARVPLVQTKWWGEGFAELHGNALRRFDRYPDDVAFLWLQPVDIPRMGLSWNTDGGGALDARRVLDDWSRLDEFIDKLPRADLDPQFDALARETERLRAQDRYIVVAWWRLFFERPWALRGMENLLLDYALEQENVHRLHTALCTQYCSYLDRAARMFAPDGFWTSDDLGHQTNAMMSTATFTAMIRPYYDTVGSLLRERGIHWWLHSCGDNTALLPLLADAGVAVFHPVQKGTMDARAVADAHGARIAFCAGIDVQHVLPSGSTDDVRAEVRALLEIFDRPDGGMCIAAGNGILPGTPLENIEAFLEESVRAGARHRAAFR
ncbi:MAG: methylcobamide--CoM methyltransferase [Ignavibacteria bacterium]|nr:methylcobamide--CoM methyltransferase [Ignavibacteria bacterium]